MNNAVNLHDVIEIETSLEGLTRTSIEDGFVGFYFKLRHNIETYYVLSSEEQARLRKACEEDKKWFITGS